MKYNLNNLDSTSFERLVQSLSKVILGNGAITFGEGTDGGREATFDGKAPYPSSIDCWNGYWVIQAKFKTINFADEEKDYSWVRDELTKELDKYSTRVTKVRQPENYLFFTNVTLTAKAGSGGRDKANDLEKEYEKKYNINHINIISNDDIQDLLNNNRDIAISFAPFVLSGDVLHKLLKLLEYSDNRNDRVNEILYRYIEAEFIGDVQSKLDHAGKLTNDRTDLEKVFIDLNVTSNYLESEVKFIDYIIEKGNDVSGVGEKQLMKYVLIAGPGYGKSTLTQFLVQIYRANLLDLIGSKVEVNKNIDQFRLNINSVINTKPKFAKIPIKIILKDYAGWLKSKSLEGINANTSLLEYLVGSVNKRSSGDLKVQELEELFKAFPCVIIFDGLDEVPISSNRSDVLVEINRFIDSILRRISTNITIIATTRQQGYYKEFDTESFEELKIADLSKENCLLYLSRLIDNLIDDVLAREEKMSILERVLEHQETSRLMKSTLQASIMAILVKSGGEPPSNKYDLFFDYFDIIFKREKQRNINEILSKFPDNVREIHDILGLYLQIVSEKSENPSATIDEEEFNSITVRYLTKIGFEPHDAAGKADDILKAVTERLVFICELQEKRIGFAIRSMQEYFAANAYINIANESDIRDRLVTLANNSYWSNTLIFAIGFIAKSNRRLVDNVESICYELNGSAEDKDMYSMSSICKSGSWLSLDILNEGSFKNFPLLTNKFSKLLKPLFYIKPKNKHDDILRLPKEIIYKWVLDFIENSLVEDNTNHTPWQLIMQLSNAGYDLGERYDHLWPIDSTEQRKILEYLVKKDVFGDFFYHRFCEYALSLEEYDFSFYISLNINDVDNIAKYYTQNNIFIPSLFTYIFSMCIEPKSLASLRLRDYFMVDIDSNTKYVADTIFERCRINITDKYVYTFNTTRIKNANFFRSCLLFAREHNLNLVKYVCNYVLNHTYASYMDLIIYVDFFYIKNKFPIHYLSSIDPIIQDYVFSSSRMSIRDFYLNLKKFETITLNDNKPNEVLEYKQIYSYLRLEISDAKENLEHFVQKYFSASNSQLAKKEYVRLFGWTFSHINAETFNKLSEDSYLFDKYKSSFPYDLAAKFHFVYIQEVFYIYTANEIFSLFKEHGDIIHANEIVFESEVNGKAWNANVQAQSLILEKIISVIKIQVALDEKPIYSILLQQLVIMISITREFNISKIPFEDVYNYYMKDGEGIAIFILLFCKNFEDKYFDLIDRLIASKAFAYDMYKVDTLLYIIGYVSNNKSFDSNERYFDDLLLVANRHIPNNYHEQRMKYENFIYKYLNSKSTGISLDVIDYI